MERLCVASRILERYDIRSEDPTAKDQYSGKHFCSADLETYPAGKERQVNAILISCSTTPSPLSHMLELRHSFSHPWRREFS
jgi:hypothetical protein